MLIKLGRKLLVVDLDFFGTFVTRKITTSLLTLLVLNINSILRERDAAIEIYLSRLEEEILIIYNNLHYNNLIRDERNALKQLKNYHSIYIKEADKGSGVVVWDREDYLSEAESQLSDPEVYEELKGDFDLSLIL